LPLTLAEKQSYFNALKVGVSVRNINSWQAVEEEIEILTSMQATTHALPHAGAHESHHEELGFWQKYVFSTDHKVIGIQYGITALLFLFFGFTLMMMMRWSMAY